MRRHCSHRSRIRRCFLHCLESAIMAHMCCYGTLWIRGLDFPVLLLRQVFTNKNCSMGILYLARSDLKYDGPTLKTIYKKKWKVEVFHKTRNFNAAMAKSPTLRVRTQSNHVFASIYSAFRLECLFIKHKMNHFALRSHLYMKTIQLASEELQNLKAA